MISNKEGNEVGYAVEINSLEAIWKEMPPYLLDSRHSRIEAISGEKPYEREEKFIKRENYNLRKI
jgi:hypothetical protein